MQLLPADHQLAIMGEMTPGTKSIFALQSTDYSLVPNDLIRRLAERVFPQHKLDVRYTDRGEFSINLILPKEITISTQKGLKDELYRTIRHVVERVHAEQHGAKDAGELLPQGLPKRAGGMG